MNVLTTDVTDIEWTPWTNEEYPKITCTVGKYTGTVTRKDPHPSSGYGNRYWKVESGDVVYGAGVTMGTDDAVGLCEKVIRVWSGL